MREPFSRKSSDRLSRLLFLVLGGAILILAFLSLWQRNQMIHIGYEIEQLKEEKEALVRVQKELLVEAESLSAMERIERIAVEQLAMKPGGSQQRVYVTTQGRAISSSEEGKRRIKKAGGSRFGSIQVDRAFAEKGAPND